MKRSKVEAAIRDMDKGLRPRLRKIVAEHGLTPQAADCIRTMRNYVAFTAKGLAYLEAVATAVEAASTTKAVDLQSEPTP